MMQKPQTKPDITAAVQNEQVAVPQAEPTAEPAATATLEPKAEPKPEAKPEPKVAKGNLRYGSWSGRVSGGKPIGFGTLTFTSSATIRCSNGGSISAQAGDKISNAEFDDDGYLYQGTWIKADGTKKTIMP